MSANRVRSERRGVLCALHLLAIALFAALGIGLTSHTDAPSMTVPAADAVHAIAGYALSSTWDHGTPPVLHHVEALEADVADERFDDDDLDDGRTIRSVVAEDDRHFPSADWASHPPGPADRTEPPRDPSRFSVARGFTRGPPTQS